MKKIFIDLGSNNGDTIESAIKLMPDFDEFIGFEPVKERNDKAIEKFINNPKVKLLNVAAGLEDKEIDFNVDTQKRFTHYGASTILNDKITGIFIKRKVKSINFSKWLKENVSKDEYVILKVDIEGFEYALLERLLEEHTIELIDMIYIEWHWEKIKSITEKRHNDLITKLKKRCCIRGQFNVLVKKGILKI